MPTSKKSAESEVGEAKPVHEHGQRFRLMAPPGFKKFAVLVGALAGLTSPAPISFINNEGGNIVMASPVFKEKKKPEEKIN